MNFISIVPYLPEIIIGFISVGLFLWGMKYHKTTEFFINILLIVLTIFIIIMYGTSYRMNNADMINIKNLIISVLGMFSLLLLKSYVGYQIHQNYERPLFLILVMIGAGVAIESVNLIEFYLAIELFTIGLYFLAFYDKNQTNGFNSGIRYFNIGILSSSIIIFGISLIYGYSESLDFNSIKHAQNNGITIGVSLVLTGILIKVGVVPFHLWLKDVYTNLKLPILAVFAILGQTTLLISLNKFSNIGFYNTSLQFFAAASILIGAIGSLKQTEFKKLIAYLVIMNTGYMMIPIIINDNNSYALILLLIAYIFAMTGLIGILCSFRDGTIFVNEIKSLSGIANIYPLRTGLFFIFMLSLVGFPPLAGFFIKFSVLQKSFELGYNSLAYVGIIASGFSLILIGRLAKIMLFEKANIKLSEANTSLKILVSCCLLFTCFYIFMLRHLLFFIKGIVI